MEYTTLSLFSGIGGMDLAFESAGFNILGMCEKDDWCSDILQYNFPSTTLHKDIKDLDGKLYEGVDIVITTPPCFIKDTTIQTEAGRKLIQNVNENDKVLTHTGRYCGVESHWHSIKDTYIVKAQGHLPTTCTKEHPFYVRKKTRMWVSSSRKNIRVFGQPEWVEAGDLTNSYMVGTHIPTTSINQRGINKKEAWIIGRFIADGHFYKRNKIPTGIVLSIGYSKVEDFKGKGYDDFYLHQHTKSCYRAEKVSAYWVELLKYFEVGDGAINKNFSDRILALPKDLLSEVLSGYLSGDGSLVKATVNTFQATTVSKFLVESLVLAVGKVYNTGSSVKHTKRPPTKIIEGRVVNQRDTYTITFATERKEQANYYYDQKTNILWNPVKSVVSTGKEDVVYNLCVADDHSYTANNIIVHNCQPVSVAGTRKGDTDERWLWEESLRIVRESKPILVIGENVKGLLTKGIENITSDLEAEGYQVRTYLLAASDCGAIHQRERVFLVGYKDWRQITNTTSNGCNGRKRFTCNAQVDERSEERKNETQRTKGCSSIRTVLPFRDQHKQWTTIPNIRGVDDGFPFKLDKEDKQRIKALGNSVVPQQALPFALGMVNILDWYYNTP